MTEGLKSDNVELLPWDSALLGVQVARFMLSPGDSITIFTAAIAQCRSLGVQLLYLEMDSADTAALLATAKELFIDSRLTYQLLLPNLYQRKFLGRNIQLERIEKMSAELEQLAWQSG